MAIDFTKLVTLVSTVGRGVKELTMLHEQAKVNEVAISLQGTVLDLQQEAMALQSDYMNLLRANDELHKKLASLDRWETEKGRYRLIKAGQYDVFVYALRQEAANGEPPHWICAKCFDEGKKTIIQLFSGDTYYQCPACKTGMYIDGTSPQFVR